jgi:hypothetical protein
MYEFLEKDEGLAEHGVQILKQKCERVIAALEHVSVDRI